MSMMIFLQDFSKMQVLFAGAALLKAKSRAFINSDSTAAGIQNYGWTEN